MVGGELVEKLRGCEEGRALVAARLARLAVLLIYDRPCIQRSLSEGFLHNTKRAI